MDCYGVDNALVSTLFSFYSISVFQEENTLRYVANIIKNECLVNRCVLEIQLSWVISWIQVWQLLPRLSKRYVAFSFFYNTIQLWVLYSIFIVPVYLMDCRHTHKKRLACLFAEGKVDQSLWLSTVSWTRQWLAQSIKKLVAFAFAGVMYYMYPTFLSVPSKFITCLPGISHQAIFFRYGQIHSRFCQTSQKVVQYDYKITQFSL